jgi:hypothetical protein
MTDWKTVEGYLILPSLDKEIQEKHFEELLGERIQVRGRVNNLEFGNIQQNRPFYTGFITDRGSLYFEEADSRYGSDIVDETVKGREGNKNKLQSAVRNDQDTTLRGLLQKHPRDNRFYKLDVEEVDL